MGCALILIQSAIVASGHATYTVGEVFPIMQQDAKKEVSLSVQKFEIPIEKPKPVVKKSLWQKLVLIIKNLFR